MNNKICDNIKLDRKKLSFEIYHKLRLLGIKTSNQGTKLIYLSLLIIINYNNEFIILEEVYHIISKTLEIQIQYRLDVLFNMLLIVETKWSLKIILKKFFLLNMTKKYLQIKLLLKS